MVKKSLEPYGFVPHEKRQSISSGMLRERIFLLNIMLILYLIVSKKFWAAYVPCEAQHRDAVQLTLEQIDVIIRLTEKYSPQLTTCTSALGLDKNHSLIIIAP